MVERYGLIWIWGGDAVDADGARMPDWRWTEGDGWTTKSGHFNIPCHYMLSVDNLMDLSHVGYVHKTTIGSTHDGEAAEIDVFAEDDHVTVRRPWPIRRNMVSKGSLTAGRSSNAALPAICGPSRKWAQASTVQTDSISLLPRPTPPKPRKRSAVAIPVSHQSSRPAADISPSTVTAAGCPRNNSARSWASTVETLNQDVDILARTLENIRLNPDADLVFIHVDEGVEKARQLARIAVQSE